MIRNTREETMQKWIVVLKIKMARHAVQDRESANAREVKVWKKHARIDQEIVQRNARRAVQRMIIRRIQGITDKFGIKIGIEIGTMKVVINMNAKNVNEAAPQSVVAKDRQNRNVMTTIARAKNEKYQVNGAKANVPLNNLISAFLCRRIEIRTLNN